MKTNELISVIVPVYNGQKYIDICVKSVLNQSYKNIELILVDDGSTDDSYKVLEKWKEEDSRVKVIKKENAGVSSARNAGIEAASGAFVTFIDVDDFIENDFLDYYYNMIKKYNTDIALTPMPRKFCDANIGNKEEVEEKIEIWDGEKTTCAMLYYNIAIGPWNKLIKKEIIDKYNIRFNTNLAYGEGFNFSVDCFQRANRVAVGNRKVYNYRVDNPNSAMTKFKLKLVKECIEAQDCIQRNLVIKTDKVINACKYARWHTYCDCLNTIVGCKVINQNKELYYEIKEVCKRDSKYTKNAPIPKADKIKGILYSINPYMAAKIINTLRRRKFTVEDKKQRENKGK